MAVETIGLSREFIIHPGETIAEAIEDREMSQHDLAVRTGMTEKHISTVINGQKNISPNFAKKLEYALGISASFWMNLQNLYDQELLQFEELNNISSEELDVLKNLKEVSAKWTSYGLINDVEKPVELVLDYRRILGISNLLDIPKISYLAAYRAQIKNVNVDPYVLFAWQRMCELLIDTSKASDHIDVDRLISLIPEIKKAMFLRSNKIEGQLCEIFSECGIAFGIVPNFTGAPVQGFIKKTGKGSIILGMTLRQKFADVFWFSLFHEIAHIINGDAKKAFVDFVSASDDMEKRADIMARNFLINPKDYNLFVSSKGYNRMVEIKRFAETQNVREFIVLGRLMKDEYIPWNDRTKYEWD